MDVTRGGLFPRSKFTPPAPGAGALAHPLAGRIDAALERAPLVALTAPAGFGKTTALGAWCHGTRRVRPVWVRLEEADDDARTFASALGAAVQAHEPRAMPRSTARLAGVTDSGAAALATALADDLDDLAGVALVLDDLHHLRAGESLELLARLLDALGPSTRVLWASRYEPAVGLLRRRARGQVVDFGADDLRLDLGAVEAVLHTCGLDDPSAPEVVLARSGGWAAAVVLMAAAVAASGRAGRGAAEALTGGSRQRLADGVVDEFIRTEVLGELDDELRRFVVVTSLLDDLRPEACAALTGRADADKLIARLRGFGLLANVGGGALGYQGRIAEALRRELRAHLPHDEVLVLHRVAASLSAPAWAVQLLLDIGDLAAAAERVVEVGRAMLAAPGARLPRRWLAAFTDTLRDGSLWRADPATAAWLATFEGLAAAEGGDLEQAVPSLDAAVATMRAHGDHLGLLRAGYGRADVHLARGEVAAAGALFDELLAVPASPDERVRPLLGQVWLHCYHTEWGPIEALLEEVLTLALGRCGPAGRSAVARGLGTELLLAPRGPRWLDERCRELGRRVGDDLMARASLDLLHAATHLIAGRFAEAEAQRAGVDARALELGGLHWLGLVADRITLGLALARGDHATVDALAARARQLFARSDRHRQERAMYAYAMARSGAQLGDVARLRSGLVLIGDVTDQDRPDTVVTHAVVRAMCARADGDLAGAVAALRGVVGAQDRTRFYLVTGLARLELAGALLAMGGAAGAAGAAAVAEAAEAAAPTLVLFDAMDATGTLAIDGPVAHRDVLAACAAHPSTAEVAGRVMAQLGWGETRAGVAVGPTGERLSAREVEVLRLVAAGCSNRQVGEALFISERTVKAHMTSVLRRLGVSSRTAAIARARQLGIT